MNIDLIKELLLIASSSSIISVAFVQKIKCISLIKCSKCLIYVSFLISMSFGILFTLSFTEYKLADSVWVGLFSFIGSDSLYKAFEDKLFTSFNKLKDVKEIERKDL
ncbi:MAG: holin [Bacilli bacterium]